MIRMTLVLLAGIGGLMVIFGNDAGIPQGSEDAARAANDSTAPGLLSRVGELIETTGTAADTTERVPLADERRAIEIALAATVPATGPATARPQTVQISAAGPASAPVAAPAASAPPDSDGMWYVTGNRVNLRGGPSTSDAVVGRVTQGQQAEVIEETADGWFRIRTLDDGQDGFIFGRFLSQNRPG